MNCCRKWEVHIILLVQPALLVAQSKENPSEMSYFRLLFNFGPHTSSRETEQIPATLDDDANVCIVEWVYSGFRTPHRSLLSSY
mmetsp:Transcript_10063/g.14722  ORF Transcript_10063/g.14722 Transcript_10063/m.14722 type:complete len:84 (-) Transcript_10063:158-409(-)